MAEKIATNGDDAPRLFSPGTFARHDEAARYVLGQPRTLPPPGSRSRFPRLSPGAWGLLESGGTITAASGTTLGTGTVKLCDNTGAVYAADESVDVKNCGSAIAASGGDRLLPMEWVLGDWTVCGGAGGTVTQTFTLNGCAPYNLRSVSIYDSPGGTLLATGTTGIGGNVSLSWSGPTTVWVQPTGTRLVGQTVTVVSGGSTTVNFGVASGYDCFLDNSCIDPVKTTLYGSCTNGVTATLVLNIFGTAWGDPVKTWFLNRSRQLTTAFTCGLDINNPFSSTTCPDSGAPSFTYSVCGGTETVTITE